MSSPTVPRSPEAQRELRLGILPQLLNPLKLLLLPQWKIWDQEADDIQELSAEGRFLRLQAGARQYGMGTWTKEFSSP